MSLFGSMRTATSGMGAQATRLSTVSDNIANVSTVGYRDASAQFASIFGRTSEEGFNSGTVTSLVRHNMTEQGTLRSTSSATDLAIQGVGFFVVADSKGSNFLTRAGSFVPSATGDLVNTGGYRLMGYPLAGSASTSLTGVGGTAVVNINQLNITAAPSTTAALTVNVPSSASVTAAANLPSANTAASTVTAKSSIIAYDNLGAAVTLDVYFNKTAANTWEMSVFNKANASAAGGFPYSAGALATQTMTFSPTNGSLLTGSALTLTVPGGATLSVDMSKTTQLATAYTVVNTQIDGNAPTVVKQVEIDEDGMLYSVYENGTRTPSYKIPLANVRSPENLTPVSGNVFAESAESGSVIITDAKTGGLGSIIANNLEESTVDLASELASMIEAQRGYSANSKVFQTGAELVDVLVNLK